MEGVTERSRPATIVGAITQNLFAGAVSSTLTIAFCLSYAALIFSGPLTPWLGYGIAVSFLSAAISGFVLALRSSLPFAIAGPDSATSAVTATLAAAAAERVLAYDSTGQLLGPVMIVLAISTALSSVFLCGLGLASAGRAIRFVPYSVIAGFLGASGWLIVSGAVRVVADQPITNFDTLMNVSSLGKLAAALGIALVLLVGRYHARSLFALPGMLLSSIVIVHLAFLLGGISLADAEASGWTFAPQSASAVALPWRLDELRDFPWKLLPSLGGDFFAVVFVTIISMLLNLTGIELATQREADLDRELNSLGIANAISAAFGGYVNCVSLSRSILNYAAGASGRLSGIIVAIASASMLVVNPSFLAYVPKCALGGLLFYIGFDLIYRWLIASWRQVLFIEYVSLAAIAIIIIAWGFVAGVLIGIVIGCAIFALNAGRVNAIKFSFDGTNYRSSLDRGAADLALLNKAGHQIQGLCLQSYLFFGSANRLYQHIKALFAKQPNCRFLVFDFRLVVGIDSSATHSFRQIKRAADESGVKLVFVNLRRELERIFVTTHFISHDIVVATDLDRALEACEDSIIAELRAETDERASFESWLTDALGSAENAMMMAQYCKRMEVSPGTVITRQGEPADSMHFILDGRVDVLVELDDGHSVRVRSLGPHTTIGEMGLMSRRVRSATVEAGLASILYELKVEDYERIKHANPVLSHALLNYVVAVMSERLSFASRVIGVLQR